MSTKFNCKRWSSKDDKFLVKHFRYLSNEELGEMLCRSRSAVSCRLATLNAKRSHEDIARIKVHVLDKKYEDLKRMQKDLSKNITDNPDNLTRAFRITAAKYNCDWKMVQSHYYQVRNSPLHKRNLGVLFAIVSKKKMLYMGKNRLYPRMTKTVDWWNIIKEFKVRMKDIFK